MLYYYKLHADVPDPVQATTDSACFDLYYSGAGVSVIEGFNKFNAPVNRPLDILKDFSIYPGERLLVPTGLIFDIPSDYSMRIHPRSGVSLKQGLILANCEGVIDADYKNPVYMIIVNTSSENIFIKNNTRLCQAEIVPIFRMSMTETNDKPGRTTERNGGFGSTGTWHSSKKYYIIT